MATKRLMTERVLGILNALTLIEKYPERMEQHKKQITRRAGRMYHFRILRRFHPTDKRPSNLFAEMEIIAYDWEDLGRWIQRSMLEAGKSGYSDDTEWTCVQVEYLGQFDLNNPSLD